jgi:uncharacterized membrane protein
VAERVPEGVLDKERERDLDRFLTFVDAIVAIAITLLVLPLAELGGEVTEADSVRQVLNDHSDDVWSFVLSFYVIAMLWKSQHASVNPLLRGTGRLDSLLMLWTFTIVVLPFPTAFVAHAGEQAATKIFYVGTMVASNLVIAAVRSEVARHPELTDGSPTPSPIHALVTPAMMLLALVVMLAFPATGYWPMLLLLLDGRVATVVQWARKRSHG